MYNIHCVYYYEGRYYHMSLSIMYHIIICSSILECSINVNSHQYSFDYTQDPALGGRGEQNRQGHQSHRVCITWKVINQSESIS